ncbi:MAG: acetyl-CoA C-acetyltransferase [Candidatus Aenigmarchaeota archaeon]|nr:acetyl-CoA C-acetyltransferase [Candidatus Aenigmarchaeota archaeon]
MQDSVVIVSAARTPIGKFLGSLSGFTAPQLGGIAIRASLERACVNPTMVDEIIMGNVLQAGAGQNPARQAAILAGVNPSIGATTVNKVCGSGLKSVMLGAQAIRCGDAQIIVAGGMESMSNAPHLLREGRRIRKYGNIPKEELLQCREDYTLIDSMISEGLWCAFNSCHMGTLAEKAGEKYKISRKEQDQFSLESHRKAIKAIDSGKFRKEVATVKNVPGDEGPRRDTNIKKLSGLPIVFGKKGTITAGNASQLSDGAAAVVLMEEDKALQSGLKPLARIEAYAQSAVDPAWYTVAPVSAVKALLKKTRHKIGDFDLVELNEAYALQALAVAKDLGIPKELLNVNGGAIALGHPIGCSGARILTTLIYAMQDRKKDLGLATLCIGGGEAVAMSVERL